MKKKKNVHGAYNLFLFCHVNISTFIFPRLRRVNNMLTLCACIFYRVELVGTVIILFYYVEQTHCENIVGKHGYYFNDFQPDYHFFFFVFYVFTFYLFFLTLRLVLEKT
jgi:hypothetical protein